MPISEEVSKTYLHSIPFKKSYKTLTYLGVIVTKNQNDRLRLNWQSKIEQVKANMGLWNTLPISMVGKMNAVKMIVLPRFIHLFQSIPCFIAQSYFKKLDSIIIPFIWNYKAVRISNKHLSKPKNTGGFALPDFKLYYWAAHLSIRLWWKKGLSSEADFCPACLCTERLLCQKTSLPALLNSPAVVKKESFNNSFVIGNTIKNLAADKTLC